MKKIAYIIPGYGGRKHKKLADIFKRHGIKPIFADIDWYYDKPAKFQHFVDDFLRDYKKPKGVKVYVFGFSFGAKVAFLAANKIKPDAFILCSLSPWFKEDLKTMERSWVKWWEKNFIDSDFSFNRRAKDLKAPTHILVGNKEDKDLLVRAKDAAKRIKKAKLTIIKGVGHNISAKRYLAAVEKVVSGL